MDDSISPVDMMSKLTGTDLRQGRTDEQIMKDGARRTLGQIMTLRTVLDQVERNVEHVVNTGSEQARDDADWRRLRKAFERLMEGME